MAYTPRNAEYTKEFNRKLFIRLLRQQPLSRAEIARRTGLTRAAASLIVDDLLSEHILRELSPTISGRGRAPTPLAVCGNAYYAAGVYLNRTGCRAGISDLSGNLISESAVYLQENDGGTSGVSLLAQTLKALITKAKLPAGKLLGVGISAPGPLDTEEGRILNPPGFALWQQSAIAPLLQKYLQLPVYLENNASSLAIYNYEKRAQDGMEDFLLLLVDSGVGSGVISGGKLLKSASNYTCELGHVSIHYKGRRCPCGNIGCLETYAAIPNLLHDWPNFHSWEEIIDSPTLQAQQALEAEASYLSAGIVTLTNLINIKTVLLAGNILYGFERLQPLISQNIAGRPLAHEEKPLQIFPALCMPGTDLCAACNIVFNRFLAS